MILPEHFPGNLDRASVESLSLVDTLSFACERGPFLFGSAFFEKNPDIREELYCAIDSKLDVGIPARVVLDSAIAMAKLM